MHGSVTENFQRQRNFKIPRRNSEFPCPELLESQESFRRRQIFAAWEQKRSRNLKKISQVSHRA